MCQSGLKGLTMGSNGSSSMHGVFYSIGMNIPTFGINGHCTETSVTQSYIHRYILHFGFFESFLDRRGYIRHESNFLFINYPHDGRIGS